MLSWFPKVRTPVSSLAAALLLVAAATPLAAATRRDRGAEAAGRAQAKMAVIDELLIAGDYSQAARRAQQLSSTLLNSLGKDAAAFATLARYCTQRALAALGQGDEATARWYWDSAWNLHPAVGELDLSTYGSVGDRLQAMPFRSGIPQEDSKDGPKTLVGNSTIQEPKALKKASPVYPTALRTQRIQRIYILQVVIDEEGRPSGPKILSTIQEPTFAYSLLETARQWSFEPARFDGEPIAVYYNFTVNFQLQ